ncbi:MAG: glucose-6-phosphate dehydrogenase assembly protein OpcA [Candidatus Limnocylindria bacterium]
MRRPETIDTETWGQPAPSVVALERELARVRRERAAHAREQVATVARAAVVNIVVVARREVHALRAAKTIATLAMRHPSRAIIVLTDARDSGPAGISLHAQLPSLATPAGDPERAGLVYNERILVRARGAVDDRISSIVVPLLVPDLPLFLWWTETPALGSPHFDELLSLASRLVVDSADFARPERTVAALATACVTDRRCALTDLNWARLTPWRELLTQFFDVPAWRMLLADIRGVRISFAVDADGREIHPSQALLLVGWLASRLEWRASDHIAPSEAGGHLFGLVRPDGERVHIRLRPRFDRGMSEGDVSGIRIDAHRGGRHTQFRLHREGGRPYAAATVTAEGALVSERIVPLPTADVVELLGEELTILASDRVFEDALALLVTLA